MAFYCPSFSRLSPRASVRQHLLLVLPDQATDHTYHKIDCIPHRVTCLKVSHLTHIYLLITLATYHERSTYRSCYLSQEIYLSLLLLITKGLLITLTSYLSLLLLITFATYHSCYLSQNGYFSHLLLVTLATYYKRVIYLAPYHSRLLHHKRATYHLSRATYQGKPVNCQTAIVVQSSCHGRACMLCCVLDDIEALCLHGCARVCR